MPRYGVILEDHRTYADDRSDWIPTHVDIWLKKGDTVLIVREERDTVFCRLHPERSMLANAEDMSLPRSIVKDILDGEKP